MAGTTYADVQTTSVLSQALRTVYSDELQEIIRPLLRFDPLCEVKRDLTREKGESIIWTSVYDIPEEIGVLVENQDVEATGVTSGQVSIKVEEHGMAVGTTEKLELLTYWPRMKELMREKLARNMALTLDTLARNAFWSGAYVHYAGGKADRGHLTPTDVFDPNYAEQSVRNLQARGVLPPDGVNMVAITHPNVIYDIRQSSSWIEAQNYAGGARFFTGELGSWGGCRFVGTTLARIPNGGSVIAQTTLAAAAAVGDTKVKFTATTGFAVGQELTLHVTQALTENDLKFEVVTVKAISAEDGVVTLTSPVRRSHAIGTFVTEGVDVYPITFYGFRPNGASPVGKAIALDPELRVALPTDSLGRIHKMGWYGVFDYGIIMQECLDRWEVGATAASM
jgi:N4-gp56 family major capsid protein